MDPLTFKNSIGNSMPPAGLSPALEALWWDAKGNWNRAHECAQKREDAAGNRVHAYLHRKEGDQSNAEYWYHRSRTAPSALSLEAEWDELVRTFLAQG